jgi:hypothetical protein
MNGIILNALPLASFSFNGLSPADLALIVVWSLILTVYIAGQGLRHPWQRRSRTSHLNADSKLENGS